MEMNSSREARLPRKSHTKHEYGFTLLELLIVIGILVILSAVVVFVLNPAETLRRSRDAQRISDLATIKSALGLYMTATSSPQLDGISGTANAKCKNGSGVKTIFYSYSGADGALSDITLDGGATPAFTDAVTTATPGLTDGTGWIPVGLSTLTGGSPISNFPVDPTNTATSTTALANSMLMYRYACDSTDTTFEVNARLESTAYTTGAEDKLTTDGGNNANMYEVGTKLTIIGSNSDF